MQEENKMKKTEIEITQEICEEFNTIAKEADIDNFPDYKEKVFGKILLSVEKYVKKIFDYCKSIIGINKETNKIIYTTSSMKQYFQYNYARHLSHLGLPFNYSFLQNIILMLISHEEIRKRIIIKLESLEKDKIILSKDEILASVWHYKEDYFRVASLLETLKKKVDDKGAESNAEKYFKKAINQFLLQINSNLPIIHSYMEILFFIGIEDTDLVHVVAPREEILFPDKIYNKNQAKENKEMKFEKV